MSIDIPAVQKASASVVNKNSIPEIPGGPLTGEQRAYLYGADDKMLGGLNSFYLLVDKPEVYGLPPDPKMPTRNLASASWFSVLGAVLVGLVGLFNFRNRGARLREEGRQ